MGHLHSRQSSLVLNGKWTNVVFSIFSLSCLFILSNKEQLHCIELTIVFVFVVKKAILN